MRIVPRAKFVPAASVVFLPAGMERSMRENNAGNRDSPAKPVKFAILKLVDVQERLPFAATASSILENNAESQDFPVRADKPVKIVFVAEARLAAITPLIRESNAANRDFPAKRDKLAKPVCVFVRALRVFAVMGQAIRENNAGNRDFLVRSAKIAKTVLVMESRPAVTESLTLLKSNVKKIPIVQPDKSASQAVNVMLWSAGTVLKKVRSNVNRALPIVPEI